jgi:CarboxypepD_reg-like domain
MFMQKIIYALAAIIFLAAFALPPQTVTVTGKVVDVETGAPIPSAAVQEKGAKYVVPCNANGSFSINLRSTKPILQVIAMGYSVTEFLISDTLRKTFCIRKKEKTF